jgi:hypothetical protein
VPDQVGDRFTFRPFRDEIPVPGQFRLGYRAIELQVKVEAAQPKRMREQDLSIQARRVGPAFLKVI